MSHLSPFPPLTTILTWSLLSPQVGLAMVNGQLYAVGGFDDTTYLKTVEMYVPDEHTWCICSTMNYRRKGGDVGVVRLPPRESQFW